MSTVRLAQWVNGFDVHSGSSTRIYRISEKVIDGVPSGYWMCNCPGAKSHGHCKHLEATGKTPVPRPGSPRREPVSEEARERQRQRTRAAFSDSAYEHFDPNQFAGFGSYGEWMRAADEAAARYGKWRSKHGEDRARRAAAGQQGAKPKVHPDLAALGLIEYPAVAADLSRAMRRRAIVLHPDKIDAHRRCPERVPGTVYKTCKHEDRFVAMMAAYDRLLGQYTGKVA